MNGTRTQPLQTIAVVGGGIVALSAAIAFARALPRTQVVLVRTPVGNDALADQFPATFASGPAMLERIGIDPEALIAAGAVTPRLATRYIDWNRHGDAWLVGEGDLASARTGGASYLLWVRGQGDRRPLHSLSPSVVAALAARSVAEEDPTSPFADAGAAWRIDPSRALPMLARIAAACKIVPAPASLAGCDWADGSLHALRLADGGLLVADLYIDATGPARLLAPVEGAASIDWSGALPCDRLLVTPAPSRDTAIDTYRATEAGWLAAWPGFRAFAYAASLTKEADARRTLGASAAAAIAIAPGRLECAWRGAVLAIGDAAVQPGPLGQTGYALALEQIALTLDLLPGCDRDPLLIAEYNRRTALRADRLRDFCALAYHADMRRPGAFWRVAKDLPRPPGVEAILASFARRGHVTSSEEDSFSRDTWASMLVGLGVHPAAPDPVLLSIRPAAASAALHRIADALAASAVSLPPHSDFAA